MDEQGSVLLSSLLFYRCNWSKGGTLWFVDGHSLPIADLAVINRESERIRSPSGGRKDEPKILWISRIFTTNKNLSYSKLLGCLRGKKS